MGGNSEGLEKFPDFLQHIYDNYKPIVTYYIRNTLNITYMPSVKNITTLEPRYRRALTAVAYHLLHGELFANMYTHNTNALGFIPFASKVISPEGDIFTKKQINEDGSVTDITDEYSVMGWSNHEKSIQDTLKYDNISYRVKKVLEKSLERNATNKDKLHAVAILNARDIQNNINFVAEINKKIDDSKKNSN